MQLLALTASRSENEKQIRSTLEQFRRQLFPGADKEQDDQMERAKKALADEAKKVYIVRPKNTAEGLRESIKKAVASGHQDLARAMAMDLHKKEQENLKLMQRVKRARERTPPTGRA